MNVQINLPSPQGNEESKNDELELVEKTNTNQNVKTSSNDLAVGNTIALKPINSGMLKQPQFGNISKKSLFDNLLTNLEFEVGERKRRKSPKVEKAVQQPSAATAVNLNELDQIFIEAQMRRNNSDTIQSKDELKSKKIILRELQDLKESLIYQ